MSSTTVPSQPAPASVNSFGRVFGVLFNPKPTFESIAQRPTWVLPLIILCLFGLTASFIIGKRIGWPAVIERQIASSPRAQKQMDQLTSEQRDQAINTQAKIAPIFAYCANILGPFVVAVIIAAILMGAFNLVGGARLNFKTSLAIVSYAWVPGLVGAALGILVLFLKDPSTIDVQNLVASNPGALLSDGSPKWLVSLLGSLDVFSFWMMILMAFGYSATDPKKISFSKAFGTVLSVWLIYVLVKVGFVAAFLS